MNIDFLIDWLTIAARWWHVLAAITWIGSSFYFNWLDSLFRPAEEAGIKENIRGTLHEVHGGNFYYHEQYFPNQKPAKLHVHAWPAKATFISGLILLVLVYWLGASSYMIDRSIADITPQMAIAISAASIIVCWFIYNLACQRIADNRLIFIMMSMIVTVAAYGFCHIYGGRAAYISLGVMLGSLMGLNVWLVIAPKSIAMQKQLVAGQTMDRQLGFDSKRRSQHNNYFTIPVLITMLSNHFALAYNNQWNWLILLLLVFVGWGIRHSLNIWYKEEKKLKPLYALCVLATLLAMWLTVPKNTVVAEQIVSDSEVMSIINSRCVSCHASVPTQAGFASAPQGLVLEKIEQVKPAAAKIKQRVLVTRDMPLGNLTAMSEDERNKLHSAILHWQKK